MKEAETTMLDAFRKQGSDLDGLVGAFDRHKSDLVGELARFGEQHNHGSRDLLVKKQKDDLVAELNLPDLIQNALGQQRNNFHEALQSFQAEIRAQSHGDSNLSQVKTATSPSALRHLDGNQKAYGSALLRAAWWYLNILDTHDGDHDTGVGERRDDPTRCADLVPQPQNWII